jgi:uncharacterized membrane protein YhiD involved in acid resistance
MKNESITFEDIIELGNVKLSSGLSLTVTDVMVALFATLLCVSIISYVYKKSYQGVLYQKSFNVAIILLSMITTAVIMVISGNLILSLGMVGALSIVRFRSAIKDPLDIVFMFWAVGIGIINGVGLFKISLTTTIVLSIVLLFLKNQKMSSLQYVFIVQSDKDSDDRIMEVMEKYVRTYRVKSKSIKNNTIEAIFEINIKEKETKGLLDSIDSIQGVSSANLVSYSNNILDK